MIYPFAMKTVKAYIIVLLRAVSIYLVMIECANNTNKTSGLIQTRKNLILLHKHNLCPNKGYQKKALKLPYDLKKKIGNYQNITRKW